MSVSQRRKGVAFEREIARAFGTQRVGSRGKADGEHCDVTHPHLFIECKRRAAKQTSPACLRDA